MESIATQPVPINHHAPDAMIIRDIRDTHEDGTYSLLADVTLENRQKTETLRLSVPSEYASWFRPSPDVFLTASIMAALWHREPHITLADAIDAQLVERLGLAMRYMRHGHHHVGPIPEIRAERTPASQRPPVQPATAIFLSGGVDSTAALHRNVATYPPGDSRRISAAFFVHGLDVGDPNKKDRPDVWTLAIERLGALCHTHGITLIPVSVNLRNLEKGWYFYAEWQFASLLAAIAHAAGARLSRCIIAPDNDIEHTQSPHGSHPWMNSYFGSDCLEIVTGDMEQFSRLDKIRMLAQHPEHLDALRVCWDADAIPAGHLNCGRCAKCIRTMIEFLACGQPEGLRAFPVKEVTADMLRAIHIRSHTELEYFEELPEPLEAVGRADLARLIRRKLWLFNAEHRLGLNRLRPFAKKLLGRH